MATSVDVVVFAAHPDDVEFGMAGTVIKLVEAGYSVMHVCLTKSEMSTHGDIELRKAEFESAAEIMGCQCMSMDFLDTGIENNRESRVKIASLLRDLRPTIVFAPYHTNPLGEPGGLVHVDHYTTGELIRDSVKFARLQKTVPAKERHNIQKLYFFQVPRTVWANLFVDVTNVMDKVRSAVRAYTSQMAINVAGIPVEEVVTRRRQATGLAIGVDYAESFVTDQPVRMSPSRFFEI